MAKELFEIWDVKGIGELDYAQVQEHFIALGLAEKPEHVLKLLRTLKAANNSLDVENSFSI